MFEQIKRKIFELYFDKAKSKKCIADNEKFLKRFSCEEKRGNFKLLY